MNPNNNERGRSSRVRCRKDLRIHWDDKPKGKRSNKKRETRTGKSHKKTVEGTDNQLDVPVHSIDPRFGKNKNQSGKCKNRIYEGAECPGVREGRKCFSDIQHENNAGRGEGGGSTATRPSRKPKHNPTRKGGGQGCRKLRPCKEWNYGPNTGRMKRSIK